MMTCHDTCSMFLVYMQKLGRLFFHGWERVEGAHHRLPELISFILEALAIGSNTTTYSVQWLHQCYHMYVCTVMCTSDPCMSAPAVYTRCLPRRDSTFLAKYVTNKSETGYIHRRNQCPSFLQGMASCKQAASKLHVASHATSITNNYLSYN